MRVKTISSIHNLQTETDLTLDNFIILQGEGILHYLRANDNIAFQIGSIFLARIQRSFCIYSSFEQSQLDGDEQINSNLAAQRINTNIELNLHSIWFVKDNSIFANQLFYVEEETVLINTRDTFFSNSSGRYETIVLNQTEFDNSQAIKVKLESLISSKIELLEYVQEDFKLDSTLIAPFNYYPYNYHNRFARANHFLTMARSRSFLPTKISFYIAALEAFFSDPDGGDIGFKMRYRIPLFLGGTNEQKQKFYEIIKISYNVRSSYLHGSTLMKKTQKYSQLISVSNELDEILRKVFVKALNDDYAHIFLDEDKLRIYFHESLLY